MSNQELLHEKANLVCELCASAGLPQPFPHITSDFAVNFTWWFEGRTHTLSLYYKPKTQSWTSVPNTAWLKNAVMPMLQPLFGQQPISAASSPPKNFTVPEQGTSLKVYFAGALDCLSLLAPFANDNIDFSIICQRTRESVRKILNDPTLSHFDRTALSALLDTPDTTNFSGAKEYLTQCLTLCHINNAAS